MAAITAALVKELREKTGVGMMDCKKALKETEGKIEEAIDWLRAKGLSKAAKKADRVAAEGLVAVAVDGHSGVLVELNAETDFVSRNEHFQKAANKIANLAFDANNVDELKVKETDDGTVDSYLTNLIATIGENMTLRRMAKVSVDKGVVAPYTHSAIAPGLGRIGVLVAVEGEGDPEVLTDVGRKVAMHVAATSPIALSTDDLDPAVVERERHVQIELARESGKPEAVIHKMIEGRMRKFAEEVVLLKQHFVMNPDQTVEEFVKEATNGKAKITGFAVFKLGEGIEKKEDDFAAEVASMTSGS